MQDAFGLEVPEMLQDACDPTRAALLVHDMQVGVLRQVPKHDVREHLADGDITRTREVVGSGRAEGDQVTEAHDDALGAGTETSDSTVNGCCSAS